MRRVTLLFALYSKLVTRFPLPFPIPCCLLVAKRSWNHDTTLFFGKGGWIGKLGKDKRTKKDALIVVWTDALYNCITGPKVTSSKFSLQLGTWFVFRCMVQWSHLTIFFFWGGGGGGQWDTLLFQPFNPLWWLASEFSLQYHSWIKHLGHENKGNDHQL